MDIHSPRTSGDDLKRIPKFLLRNDQRSPRTAIFADLDDLFFRINENNINGKPHAECPKYFPDVAAKHKQHSSVLRERLSPHKPNRLVKNAARDFSLDLKVIDRYEHMVLVDIFILSETRHSGNQQKNHG
jgi:hypothetical protein